MHYHEFETAFESHLQTHTDVYPHAVGAHNQNISLVTL